MKKLAMPDQDSRKAVNAELPRKPLPAHPTHATHTHHLAREPRVPSVSAKITTNAAAKGAAQPVKKPVNYMNISFIGTILFFGLSLLHISFALIGLVCAATPFVLHAIHQDKSWCKNVCPRASLFTKVLSPLSLGLKAPRWLFGKGARRVFLIWFIVNFTIAVMSTLMVSIGRIEPMAHVRFLLAFRMPFQLPQLIDPAVAPAIIHFGYRIFSLMFTSTTIGLVLGLLFRPRSWCSVCPIATLTPIKRG